MTMTMRGRCAIALIAGWFCLAAACTNASAQTSEIRIARQTSMGFLQFNLMERLGLIEKHAKASGLTEVKVTWATFNSTSAMNDALLAERLDIVTAGVPGLLTIWAKTKGMPLEVKGIAAFSSQPCLLNTRNPAVKSIADFTEQDKIAVPTVKVSLPAMLLQMAAAKQWGKENYAKLDPLTFAMTPPDATIALLSGGAGLTSVFSLPPFQEQQLEKEGIRTVVNSYDVFGGPHTYTVAYTSSAFRDKNPVLYKALLAAFQEATAMLEKDVTEAARFWIDDVKSKLPLEKVVAVASGKQVRWTMTPQNTMGFAAFMADTGQIKVRPADWKDYFFPEIHSLPGS